jgi:hypothetical protein
LTVAEICCNGRSTGRLNRDWYGSIGNRYMLTSAHSSAMYGHRLTISDSLQLDTS